MIKGPTVLLCYNMRESYYFSLPNVSSLVTIFSKNYCFMRFSYLSNFYRCNFCRYFFLRSLFLASYWMRSWTSLLSIAACSYSYFIFSSTKLRSRSALLRTLCLFSCSLAEIELARSIYEILMCWALLILCWSSCSSTSRLAFSRVSLKTFL